MVVLASTLVRRRHTIRLWTKHFGPIPFFHVLSMKAVVLVYSCSNCSDSVDSWHWVYWNTLWNITFVDIQQKLYILYFSAQKWTLCGLSVSRGVSVVISRRHVYVCVCVCMRVCMCVRVCACACECTWKVRGKCTLVHTLVEIEENRFFSVAVFWPSKSAIKPKQLYSWRQLDASSCTDLLWLYSWEMVYWLCSVTEKFTLYDYSLH